MDEKERVFQVRLKITKDIEGNFEDDVNYEQLVKIIKKGIEESCTRTVGVINSYLIGDVKEIMENENEKEYEDARSENEIIYN